MTDVDVLVVGAGPGGSVAATMLARSGLSVLVVEKSQPERLLTGTGILLQPNGLAVLYGLGLEEQLRGAAVLHRSVPILDQRDRLITTGELPDFGSGLDHALALLRGSMQQTLWSALESSGAEVRFGAEVEDVDPASGTVQTNDAGVRSEVVASLVVGADGIGSHVRRGGDFRAQVSGAHKVFRAVVAGQCELDGAEYWTPLGLFGGSSVGHEATYLCGSADAPEVDGAIAARDPRRLAAAWGAVLPKAGRALERITSADQILLNEVGRVRCRTFVDRHAVLIGDAAHSMAPNLGQGANSAFVDAATLALAVSALGFRDGSLRYDHQRRRSVTRVQRNADLLATVSHLRSPLLGRIRDAAFRLGARPWLVRRQIAATQQVQPADLLARVRGAYT